MKRPRKSRIPAQSPLTTRERKEQMAVQSVALDVALSQFYEHSIATHAQPAQTPEALALIAGLQEGESLQTCLSRLQSSDGMTILNVVWRLSDHVSDRTRAMVDIPPDIARRNPGLLTRHALGRWYAEAGRARANPPTETSAVRSVSRIIDAAIIYDLIHEQQARPNLKPLRATPLLDKVFTDYAELLMPLLGKIFIK